jgi:hypothetical protein
MYLPAPALRQSRMSRRSSGNSRDLGTRMRRPARQAEVTADDRRRNYRGTRRHLPFGRVVVPMSDADRYVTTPDIRVAIRGHETGILDGLGIDWQQSKASPHTNCPYLDHADTRPSWRWDARKRRAFCTCGARDVLGVLMGVEGIEFGPAKIRAAELLKRPDLIKERHARKLKGGRQHIPPEQHRNGATLAGCSLVDYAVAKRLPIDFLRSLGLSEITYQGAPAVKIPYFAADGTEAVVRFRIALDGKDRFRWRQGSQSCLYGLDRLDDARTAGFVVLVEGESDCHTLWRHGLPGLGLPGNTQWSEGRDAPVLADIPTIYVVVEPDPGGETMRKGFAGSSILPRVRVIRLLVKDASALHLSVDGDPERFRTTFQAALDVAEPYEGTVKADSGSAHDIGVCGGKPPKQADILIALATEAKLFHAPGGTGYADLVVGGHRESWPIRSKDFRRWLARRFWQVTRGAPSSEAFQSALNIIEAQAHFDAPERTVHVRVAGLDDKLYLDLGDAQWRAVEVNATGWRVISDPPVRFRRTSGMRPLPAPETGGSIQDLYRFVNLPDERARVLVVEWLLAAYRDHGPYPVLVLSGEQGTAKSMLAAILRGLIDPNTAPLRSLPRDDRDLFIAATNGHVIAIDNVSYLPDWLSDAFCRIATGGGFSTRTLYSDQDETLFDAMRPIVLTGIEDVVVRGDLADRSISQALDPIPGDRRRAEKEMWAEFDQARPRILGVLLNAVSHGLHELPNTRLDRLPRMADFAKWATACEGALWPKGAFVTAYDGNRAEADQTVIEADMVATVLRSLMATTATWIGTASELLPMLTEQAGDAAAKAKTWPKSPRGLSGRLRRAAPNLRRIGIHIAFDRGEGRKRNRIITISSVPLEIGDLQSSAPSELATVEKILRVDNGLALDGLRAQKRPADASAVHADGTARPTVRANILKKRAADGAAGADAVMSTLSDGDAASVDDDFADLPAGGEAIV